MSMPPPPPGPPPGPQPGSQPGSQPGPPPGPPRAPRSPVLIGLLVGVLLFAVAGAGFAAVSAIRDNSDDTSSSSSGSSEKPTPSAEPSTPLPSTAPTLARYYHQKLQWGSCGSDKCATMAVPLDYAQPAGQEIRIAILKVPAARPSERVGSLVVNPGGPGGSGTEFASYGALQFGSTLADHFDIVGFDPRGVANSDPLKCATTEQLDALLGYDPDPDNAAERNELDHLTRVVGDGCLSRSGELARHMSTQEAARDMDILRAALGEAKLDYLGSSYGTFLGATYANLFPKHVGRFVLDGAIDPALSNEKLALEQAGGFQTALDAYISDCVGKGGCFLGGSVKAGEQRIRAFLDQVGAHPLPTGQSRTLTDGWATLGIFFPLYVKDYWPMLTSALQAAFRGDGSKMMALADQYASRGSNGYKDNSMEALYAVNCLDHDDYILTKDVPQHFAEFLKASPTFGRFFAFGLSTCSAWPVRSGKHTVALHAKGAPPIVVVGTTRDPATPLAWAQALARELDSGRLVTRDGDGHTGFQRGNSCVDDAVENWLVSGTVPRANLMC
ncbi:MAG: alpha/beta hydrolase [Marmoricola sp.]